MKISYLFLFILLTFFLVFIDQYTKALFIKGFSLKLNEYVRFILVYNEGSAFGIKLFSNQTYIVLAITACLLIILFNIFYNIKLASLKNRNLINLFNLSMVLILSGTMGNLLDRIKYSKVVDWISILNFPVFNLADSYITTGVIIFLYFYFKLEKINQKTK